MQQIEVRRLNSKIYIPKGISIDQGTNTYILQSTWNYCNRETQLSFFLCSDYWENERGETRIEAMRSRQTYGDIRFKKDYVEKYSD